MIQNPRRQDAKKIRVFLLLFFQKKKILSSFFKKQPEPGLREARKLLVLPLLLSACATPRTHPAGPGVTPKVQLPASHGPAVVDDHVPPFAAVPWEPFSRAAAVAIAQGEWRLFGQPIDDDPPESRPPPPPELKPEREQGLWQRIGEYWWVGQDPYEREVAWTGKHDENGVLFDPANDGNYAWSAAFISYVMRIAGAGPDFPYSPNHATYINAAALGTSKVLRAYAPQSYAPMAGDLICLGRGKSANLTFAALPTADLFPAHCDIVVGVSSSELTVIGGNVDDAVTLKHVPIGSNGLLTGADGKVLDTRYGWMVVLKVLYAQ
jgi:hypothetical protein